MLGLVTGCGYWLRRQPGVSKTEALPADFPACLPSASRDPPEPRHTGYQVWNKQRRDEVLLDVDDVAVGHISRMRWNPKDQWVHLAEPTHPPLVSREILDQVQARIAAGSPISPRTPRPPGGMCCGGRLT